MAFTPRLTDTGILNNPKWYAQNPFYQSNFGLPNCTCYAWRLATHKEDFGKKVMKILMI